MEKIDEFLGRTTVAAAADEAKQELYFELAVGRPRRR